MDLVQAITEKNGQESYRALLTALTTIPLTDLHFKRLKVLNASIDNWQQFTSKLASYLTLLYSNSNAVVLFGAFDSVFTSFVKIFEEHHHRFLLKALLQHFFLLALRTDKARVAAGIVEGESYDKCLLKVRGRIDTLQNRLMNDRSPSTASKSGIYLLATSNLRTLFSLRELSLGPKVIQQTQLQIERKEMFEWFSVAQRVSYNYFCGRLYLCNHEFAEADKCLTYAFNRCPRSHQKHKKMIRGSYPTLRLLQKYALSHLFGPLILAQTSGNYLSYHAHLLANQRFFIGIQCYSVLKYRTEQLILRNLFFQGMMDDVRVPCETLLQLCRFARVPASVIASIYDIEATVVSMIDQGFMKGYLVHVSKILVLSKQDALPNPYSVNCGKFGDAVMTVFD